MTDEWWDEGHLEGSGRGLTEITRYIYFDALREL
jgi:hypothetical protein